MFLRLAALAFCLGLPSLASAGLVNPGLEYGRPNNTWGDYSDASINPSGGWFTTASDRQIEIWGTGYGGVSAYQGSNFAELNANMVSTIYQDTTGISQGDKLTYQFAHRGRLGVDTMRFSITNVTQNTTWFTNLYSDGNTAWGFYTGSLVVPSGTASTDKIRFSYASISASGNSPTYGNFVDAADYSLTPSPMATPEPATLASAGLALVGAGIVAVRRRGLPGLPLSKKRCN